MIAIPLLTVSLLLILFSTFFYLKRAAKKAHLFHQPRQHMFSPDTIEERRIGIITPLLHEATYALTQGIQSHVNKSRSYRYVFSHYHGDNDRITLCEEASKALRENDIIVSYGLAATNIAFEAIDQTQSNVLLLSAGLRHHHIPLIKQKNPGKILYSVVSERNYFEQVKRLTSLKPSLQHVLIMYRQSNEWLVEEIKNLTKTFHAHAVEATPYLITHSGHIDNQIDALNKTFDTIFLMPRSLEAKGLQELITYCNQTGITLCTNEHDPVVLGAAIGFGGEAHLIGSHLGHIVRQVLEAKEYPKHDHIIDLIDTYRIAINQAALSRQGVNLNKDALFLLNQGFVRGQTL